MSAGIDASLPTAQPREGSNEPPSARVRSIVDRIVHLEEERRELSADIKDIYTEAKSAGFTPAAIRILVRRELESAEKRADRIAVEGEVEMLTRSLGLFAETGLGQAALAKAGRA